MTPYGSQEINHSMIQDLAKKLLAAGLIESSEKSQLHAAFPTNLHSVTPFLRAVYLALTTVGIAGVYALCIISFRAKSFFALIVGLGCIAALEVITKKYRHWGTGVDDGLLLCATAFILAFCAETFGRGGLNTALFVSLILLTLLSFRYVNFVGGCVASIGMYWVIAYSFKTVSVINIAALIVLVLTLIIEPRHWTTPWYRLIAAFKATALLAFFVFMSANFDWRHGYKTFDAGMSAVIAISFMGLGLIKKDSVIFRSALICSLLWFAGWQMKSGLVGLDLLLIFGGVAIFFFGLMINIACKSPLWGFSSKPLLDPGYGEYLEQLKDLA